MSQNLATVAAAVFLLLAGTACSDDEEGPAPSSVGNEGDVVGGACTTGQCADGSYCELSGSFPGGVCTVTCNSHADCPSGTRCISNQSGICLLECLETSDCRSGYRCDIESDEEGGGESRVCTD